MSEKYQKFVTSTRKAILIRSELGPHDLFLSNTLLPARQVGTRMSEIIRVDFIETTAIVSTINGRVDSVHCVCACNKEHSKEVYL